MLAQFLEVDDSLLAYRFVYPVMSASGKKIPIIFSRRPERYSSAAPLSVDARQRIVTSLTSLQDAITISVSVRVLHVWSIGNIVSAYPISTPGATVCGNVRQVGPPSGVLARTAVDSWTAKQVAETVLADRSTSRVTAGQRVALNSVEDPRAEQRDGQTYWVSGTCVTPPVTSRIATRSPSSPVQSRRAGVRSHLTRLTEPAQPGA